jgi:hypothetical protein
MIATNDVLSQGRVTMGIGVSWVREQFETLPCRRRRPARRGAGRCTPHPPSRVALVLPRRPPDGVIRLI